MEDHKRLIQVVEKIAQKEGISKSAVGDRLGYKSGHWFMILNGKRTITDRLLISMKAVYGVNIEFITKGTMPMFREEIPGFPGAHPEVLVRIHSMLKGLSNDELQDVLKYVSNKKKA